MHMLAYIQRVRYQGLLSSFFLGRGRIFYSHPWHTNALEACLSHHVSSQHVVVASFTRLLTCGLCASTNDSSGLTWLELMCLSIAMADNPWALLHSTTAQTQHTIARQLREFAIAAIATLKFALGDDEQHFFLVLPSRLTGLLRMVTKIALRTTAHTLRLASGHNHNSI